MKDPNKHRRTEFEVMLLVSEAGQSMAEFLIVLPVILMLIFGTIQLALIFHAKITLNYAVFEAARAGSLGNADFEEVKEGFARGLAPLYTYFDAAYDTDNGDKVAGFQVEAFQKARNKVLDLFDDEAGLVRIERLNPDAHAFLRHGSNGEIPNDNLLYRSAAFNKSTDPNQPTEMSLQDANLLHLRVTYWYPLYVPFVNLMIHGFICCKADEECRWKDDPACDPTQPRIPLTAVAAIRMQSPARGSDEYYQRFRH